jgi:endoglucanase
MFPAQLEKVKLNIPSNAMPDILTEIKYELDWLLTMQREDGAVYHLITTKIFPPAGTMPEKEKAKRYIVPLSTAATGDFAAVMAIGSRVYAKYDPAYSKKLLQAAISAWNFLDTHKTSLPKGGYKDPAGIKGTGAYDDDDDRDERFWAAGELLTATGDGRYNDYIKKIVVYWQPSVVYPFSWKDVHVLGVFSYLQCDPKLVDADIRNKMLGDLLSYASRLVTAVQQNGFLVALGPNDYYWGSNGVALCNGITLLMANRIKPNQQYFNTALDQLHYVLGRNALNRSFVTGFGSNPPRHPLHTPSMGDKVSAPVPGLLVGGPNDRGDDKYLAWQKRKFNLPSAKCYLDDDKSYSSNEVSIYWNALLVFVSGYVSYCQP